MAKPTDEQQLAQLLTAWKSGPIEITRETDGRFTLTAHWRTDDGGDIFMGSACTFAGAVKALHAELRRAGAAS